MLGTYALSAGYYDAYYLKAQKVRTLIRQDFDRAFAEVDVIAPTTPTTAFRIGEKTDDLLAMYLSDVLTLSASLAGIAGVSVPCGFDGGGLPIGLQIIGPAFDSHCAARRRAYQRAWLAHAPPAAVSGGETSPWPSLRSALPPLPRRGRGHRG